MRRVILWLFALFFVATASSDMDAASFRLVRRYGEPIKDRQKATAGRILFASWIDDDSIVFNSDAGRIVRLSMKSAKIKWSIDDVKEIQDWSVSRGASRLAYLAKGRVYVVDCKDGSRIVELSGGDLARIMGIDSVDPCCLALSPKNGQLIVCNNSYSYGRNAYVLDPSYRKILRTCDTDAYPHDISLSRVGRYVSVIADKNVLNVRDVTKNCDVFFRGHRILIDPKTLWNPKTMTGSVPPIELVIDAPYFSHIRYDGRRTVVYSRDGGLSANGEVFVRDLCSRQVNNFDAGNGHIEMDVDFRSRRIILTGTSRNLTLVDFAGKKLAHATAVTMQGNLCVEFSPSGHYVLVGSWDNTLSVYKIGG